MDSDRALTLLIFALIIILPASALLRRRMPARDMIRMALWWAAIIVGLVLLIRLLGLDGPHAPIVSTAPMHFT